jgi:chromatin assembly factor 1 subunit B
LKLHDSQSLHPIGLISGVHFAGITDIAWSPCGSMLCISSSDGYCSIASFAQGELGTPLSPAEQSVYVLVVLH